MKSKIITTIFFALFISILHAQETMQTKQVNQPQSDSLMTQKKVSTDSNQLKIGMSVGEVYDCIQKILGNPDAQLIKKGHSAASVAQGRQDIIDFANFTSPGEKFNFTMKPYKLVFVDGKLIEFTKE